MFILKEKMSVTVLFLKIHTGTSQPNDVRRQISFFRILTKSTLPTVPSVVSLASLERSVDLSNW